MRFQEADADTGSEASSPIHFGHTGNGTSLLPGSTPLHGRAKSDLPDPVNEDPTAFMSTDETAQFEADKRKIYK